MIRLIYKVFILLFFFVGCNKETMNCLVFGEWEFSYVANNAQDCLVYCGTLVEEVPCEAENIFFYDYCRLISFFDDGTYELTLDVNEAYIKSGTWTGGCSMGDIINIYDDASGSYYSLAIINLNNNSMLLEDNNGGRSLLNKKAN